MTHTFTILKISKAAYEEIRSKLADADYQHVFIDDVMDMHGIALQPEETSE